jgi:DNA-directed RNA polymerase subunit H (RpoH/RPB5)
MDQNSSDLLLERYTQSLDEVKQPIVTASLCEWCIIREATLEMFQYRGLTLIDNTENASIDDMTAMARILDSEDEEAHTCCNAHHPSWYLCRSTVPTATLFIVTKRKKIGMAQLKLLFHRARLGNTENAIQLVTKYRISSFAQQSMRSLYIANMCLTSILWSDVTHNPLKHFMVPPHRLVSRSYVRKQLPSVSNLAMSELPKIRSSDPVVRYLGLRTGQIVAIQRGRHEEAYRVVVV